LKGIEKPFFRIRDVCFDFPAGRLHFKPASCILRRTVLSDLYSGVVATALMSLNGPLRLSKAVDIKKWSSRAVVLLGRLLFLRRDVVGVSPARIVPAIANTAPMEMDSIVAIELWDILPLCNRARK